MDKLKHFKEQIRQALLKNFWNPFELLLTRIDKDSKHYPDLILIGSRHESIRKSIIEGVIPTNDYVVEGNKIRKALLALLEEIEETDLITLKLEDTTIGLVVEKAETIRTVSRDQVRGESVLLFPQLYELLCLAGILFLINMFYELNYFGMELLEEFGPLLMLVFVLFLFGCMLFLYRILRITIRAQNEVFTAGHRLQIQITGVQESVLDVLIRMNAALGCKIIEVDHQNAHIKSIYTQEMKIAKKRIHGLVTAGEGIITFHFSVAAVPDSPLKKEIIINTEFPLDHLPAWIPKEAARKWIMPVTSEEVTIMVEQSFQLMEDYLFSEFGQTKATTEQASVE